MVGLKRTWYVNETIDTAIKYRAIKDHVKYSAVVVAALEQYLDIAKSKKKS